MTPASEPETLVERVAIAVAEAGAKCVIENCGQLIRPDSRTLAEALARAAIEVVVEEAAKVAQFSLAREPGGWPLRDPTPAEIATAIRNLPRPGEQG